MPTPDWNSIATSGDTKRIPEHTPLAELEKVDHILKLLRQVSPGCRVFVGIHLATLLQIDRGRRV